jgi:hypothetical protein
MRSVWHLFITAADHKGNAKFLRHAGYTSLITILITWVVGTWLGYGLILMSDTHSVIPNSSEEIVDNWEKLYFAGYVLSTLGNGDLMPGSDGWRIVTVAFSFFGLMLFTTSISYFVPVLSAVIFQRKLSVYINSMGDTPQQILINGWNGRDFSRFLHYATNLNTILIEHSQNHLVYPIIHYFHSSKKEQSAVISIAKLAEALMILTNVVADDLRPDPKDIRMLQHILSFYLETIERLFISGGDSTVPNPDYSLLEQAGIPTSPDYLQKLAQDEDLTDRRRGNSRLLRHEGWGWEDVYSGTAQRQKL